MKKLILILVFPFLLQSQNFPELDVSPMDKAHFSRQKEVATITYSRPQLKGRALKDILKLNNIWRTGANEANELLLYVDIEINNTVVPKGTYKIFTYLEEKEIIFIISSSTKMFGGASAYNSEMDVIRFKVPKRKVKESLEAFSIVFSNKDEQPQIHFGWEYMRFDIPFKILGK